MMAICPAGHETEATDYCDTCGAPVDMLAQPAPTAPAPALDAAQQPGEKRSCPNCQASNVADALFCEACGYDFTTGVMPRTSIFDIGTKNWGVGAEQPAEAEARAEEAAQVVEADSGDEDEVVDAEAVDADSDSAADTDDADIVDAEVVDAAAVDADKGETPADAGDQPAAATDEAEVPAVAPDVDDPDANPPEADMVDEGGPAPDADADADAGQAQDEQAEDEAEKTTATAALPAPDAAVDEGPSAVAGADVTWVAEVWIDPDWYAVQQSPESLPSPGLPTIVPLRKQSVLIGRPSRSRGIIPDIDCESDSGCSRRHAELTTDGTRWWIEDLGSSNGTYIGSAGAPLPERPIRTGKHELGEDDRIYVGAWTRIVIRHATADEQEL